MAHNPYCLCSECVSDPVEAVTRAIEGFTHEADAIFERNRDEDETWTGQREGHTVLVKSRGQWVRITVELA